MAVSCNPLHLKSLEMPPRVRAPSASVSTTSSSASKPSTDITAAVSSVISAAAPLVTTHADQVSIRTLSSFVTGEPSTINSSYVKPTSPACSTCIHHIDFHTSRIWHVSRCRFCQPTPFGPQSFFARSRSLVIRRDVCGAAAARQIKRGAPPLHRNVIASDVLLACDRRIF